MSARLHLAWLVALVGASCFAPEEAVRCVDLNDGRVYYCGPGEMCMSGRCATANNCTSSDPNACGASCMKCMTSEPNAVAVCRQGSCGIECKPGACLVNGACIDVMGSDPKNCGACGRACTSGQCSNGVCPTEVAAMKTIFPTSLMVAPDGSIVWLESTTGGLINQIKPGQSTVDVVYAAPMTNVPVALGVDVDAVYWAERNQQTAALGRVQTAKWTDRTPVVLANSQNNPYGLSVPNDGFVYWTNNGDGLVQRVGKSGGMFPTPLAALLSDKDLRGLAVKGDFVFFANRGASEVQQVEVATGTMKPPTKIAGAMQPESVLLAPDGNIFWTEFSTAGRVRRYSSADKQTKDFAIMQNVVFGLAADDKYIYWTEKGTGGSDGAVRRIKLDGSESTPTYIAKGQPSPTSIAVDGQYVYWTTNIANGQVLKTSK